MDPNANYSIFRVISHLFEVFKFSHFVDVSVKFVGFGKVALLINLSNHTFILDSQFASLIFTGEIGDNENFMIFRQCLLGRKMIFSKNDFFQISLFGTVEDGKLFFKKIIFPPMEKNDFHF